MDLENGDLDSVSVCSETLDNQLNLLFDEEINKIINHELEGVQMDFGGGGGGGSPFWVDEFLEERIDDDLFVDFLETFEIEQKVGIESSTPRWLIQDNSVYTMASFSKKEVKSIINSVMSISELCGWSNIRNTLLSCPSCSGMDFICTVQVLVGAKLQLSRPWVPSIIAIRKQIIK